MTPAWPPAADPPCSCKHRIIAQRFVERHPQLITGPEFSYVANHMTDCQLQHGGCCDCLPDVVVRVPSGGFSLAPDGAAHYLH